MQGTTRIWHATIPSPTHTWLAHRHNCSGSNSSENLRCVLHNIRSPSRCILAPVLFCCVIDWFMRHCSGWFGVDVGNFHRTDINYADDAVLFTDDQRNSTMFFEILRHQQALWGSTQTGIKRRSKILELEMLQKQSILTIKQYGQCPGLHTWALI